jgi:two-component system cell cycle response regulator DivK
VGQKILVVEDNELNLKLFCDLLRAHAYAAEPVRDGREAVARARAFEPDLIVMDIQMPHISGLELIDQLKADAELKRVPIMAVTAYAAKGDEERIRDAGAEGYVSKPISVVRFVGAVRELLQAAAEREEEEEEEAAAQEEDAVQEEASATCRHPGEGRDLVEQGADGVLGDPGLRRDDEFAQRDELLDRPDEESRTPADANQAGSPAGDSRLQEQTEEGEEPPRLI